MVIEHAERFGLAQLAPVARARRARRQTVYLSAALQAPLGRVAEHASRSCAKPKMGSALRRKISSCAAKVKFWAHVNRARRVSDCADGTSRDLLEIARDDARLILNHDPELDGDAAKRCGSCSICFRRTKLCAAARRLRLMFDYRLGFDALRISGATSPAEITSLAASQPHVQFNTSSRARTRRKPDVGFGVVGKNTLTVCPCGFVEFAWTLSQSIGRDKGQRPQAFAWIFDKHHALETFESSRKTVSKICLSAE